MGITTNVLNFPQLSLYAMKKLQDLDKSNTVYNLSKVISESRPDGSDSLMPLRRMPFGMIQFIVDFFASTNVMEVTIGRFFLKKVVFLDEISRMQQTHLELLMA